MKALWKDILALSGIGLILWSLYLIWLPLFLFFTGAFILYLVCYHNNSNEKK